MTSAADMLSNPLKKRSAKHRNGPDEKQAERLLKSYLKEDAMHLLQVRIFQSSQRNVLENLPKQVSFISEQVETFFKLTEA